MEQGYSRYDLALNAVAWTVNKHPPFATDWNPPNNVQCYIPQEIKERPHELESPEKLSTIRKKGELFFSI